MKKKILLTAVCLLTFLFVVSCTPDGVEPESAERIPTRNPEPSPTFVTEQSPQPFPTAILPLVDLPLSLDKVPESLPVYIMRLEPIPETREQALAWASSFGLPDGEVVDDNGVFIRVLSLDETGKFYEELTFDRTQFNEAITYSRGIYWQNFSGPTPTPDIVVPDILPSEFVLSTALSFVRENNLLPEPMVAHERPGFNDDYVVHVSFAPEGLRLTSIGNEPGVRVRIDRNGQVVEARIVQASFERADSLPITSLEEIYPAFVRGDFPNTMFNQRGQFGDLQLDPMRFQVYSLPFGDWGDRVELVYAPLPTSPERVLPMWLISRPHMQSWSIFDEYYLSPVASENIPRPGPTPTPLAQTAVVPETLEIVPPLLVEEADGRLFTNAVVDGITHTVSLDAATGDLLAVYGLMGDLALDDGRNLLFVDLGANGLTVIDTTTGEVVNAIRLPAGERSYAQIQVDPSSGNVFLFRDQMLLVADPLSPTWQQTIPITVEGTVCDEPMEDSPVIDQTWFDEEARLLYMSLVDYVCTPWISYTIVVYDMNSMSEVARYPELDYTSGAAANGRFYGKSWFRMGRTFEWGWQNGQPWLEQRERGEDITGAFSGFQVDEGRGWLYEMTVNGLQVLNMETMAVLQTIPAPVIGQLVGFDPVTDNLYFVEEESGRLVVWTAENLQN